MRSRYVRRWRLEREFDVLKLIQENTLQGRETSSWQLIRYTNLNWSDSMDILAELVTLGMVVERHGATWKRKDLRKPITRRYYSLTRKGEDAIRDFEALEDRFKVRDKPIEAIPY